MWHEMMLPGGAPGARLASTFGVLHPCRIPESPPQRQQGWTTPLSWPIHERGLDMEASTNEEVPLGGIRFFLPVADNFIPLALLANLSCSRALPFVLHTCLLGPAPAG